MKRVIFEITRKDCKVQDIVSFLSVEISRRLYKIVKSGGLPVVSFPDRFFPFLFVMPPPQLKKGKAIWERDYI